MWDDCNFNSKYVWTDIILANNRKDIFFSVFVPFAYLNDMISAGVLLTFNLTNT